MSRSKVSSVSSSNGQGMASAARLESGEPAEPRKSASPQLKKRENFFDMPEEHELDIWSPNFPKDLTRKSSGHQVAAIIVEDTSCERVGGAFIDEERILKLPQKRSNTSVGFSEIDGAASSKGGSISQTYSQGTREEPQRSSVRRLDLEYDRVKELEDKIEKLELARWKPPSIPEIMDRLLLGKPCSMSYFKSMDDKKNLLDAAISTNDGNCIMAVVLFVKRTVDQSIFLNVLEKRREAAQHYINFLKQLRSWKDLKALYRRLNRMETLAYFSLQECDVVGLSAADRIRLIKSCPTDFRKAAHLCHTEDLQHVEEYSRLIHMQNRIEDMNSQGAARGVQPGTTVLFQPLTTTLLFCCRHFRGQEKKAGNPEELRKLFNISDNQYFQMDLLALALRRDWKGIEKILTTKGVLGIGKKKKSPIGFERVVRLLGQGRYRATDDILIGYLNEIDDLEERYCLAMEVGLYVAALDTLVATRDRERVANFINSVPPKCHYEIRGKIDQALRNSQIKWK